MSAYNPLSSERADVCTHTSASEGLWEYMAVYIPTFPERAERKRANNAYNGDSFDSLHKQYQTLPFPTMYYARPGKKSVLMEKRETPRPMRIRFIVSTIPGGPDT